MSDEPLDDEIELEPDLPPGQVPDEDSVQRRSIKRTALAQGSKIPLGWKPSIKKPISVVQCTYIYKDSHPRAGEQCSAWSMRGSLLCWAHSGRGNLKNVEEYRQAIIESARLELTQNVPMALGVIFDIAQHGNAENVRLKAAETILDRTGIRAGTEIDVQVNDVSGLDPAQVLAERLGKLKQAADTVAAARVRAQTEAEARAIEAAAPLPVIDTDAEVIDGEIVSEDADPAGPDQVTS